MDFSASNLLGGIIFSGIGFAALIYGKKQSSFKPMIIGGVLLVYPYFVSNIWLLYGIGLVLTAFLFIRTE